MAFGATIYDGVRCKIFTFTCLDNDAAYNETVALDGAGGRPGPLPGVPLEADLYIDTCTDFDLQFAITGIAGNQIIVRKLTAAGAGGAVTVRVVARIPRGIAG